MIRPCRRVVSKCLAQLWTRRQVCGGRQYGVPILLQMRGNRVMVTKREDDSNGLRQQTASDAPSGVLERSCVAVPYSFGGVYSGENGTVSVRAIIDNGFRFTYSRHCVQL